MYPVSFFVDGPKTVPGKNKSPNIIVIEVSCTTGTMLAHAIVVNHIKDPILAAAFSFLLSSLSKAAEIGSHNKRDAEKTFLTFGV